jgi:hypothetical protein
MLTETQMADRLAMIKEVAEKRSRQSALKARLAKKASAVKGWMDEVEKPAKAPTQNLTEKYDGYNENHYTDASKYAKEHYGERYNQTTRFDNDWGDY